MRLACWLLLALASPALAGDKPDVRVADDGTVTARMLVDAPPAAVRQAISEVQSDTRGLTNVLSVRLTAEGECHKVERTTRGLLTPLTMRTRFCPTPKGWREYLVQSDSYDRYNVEWTVEPKGSGSEVSLIVQSGVNFYVPDGLMRAGTVQGVNESFLVLLKRIFAARATP